MNLPLRRRNRPFTLLEVMIAIVLITLIGGTLSHRMHRAIERKKFHSDIERVKSRMLVAQKLALSTQADWYGTLKKEEKGWVFTVECEENCKKLKPLHLAELDIKLSGKPVRTQLSFDFFASGHISPDGVVLFERKSHKSLLKPAELFQREEGTKSGPLHPNIN